MPNRPRGVKPHPVTGLRLAEGMSAKSVIAAGVVAVPRRGSPVHVGSTEAGEDLKQPGRALDDEDVKERCTNPAGAGTRGQTRT